ncbi:MAG TPA: PilW family protein [Dyella sp.]|uniref:PilW family protein n=1 Tax=Dyella sp. TaxID=1869338 RepID=UPI002F946D06
MMWRAACHQRGISLIELLVAMMLGLLVSAAVIGVFLGMSTHSRIQRQLARLQEEGRFAVGVITQDLAAANGQYCNNTGGIAKRQANGIYLDRLRAPLVYAVDFGHARHWADLTTPMGNAPYPAAPDAPYALPSFLSMRGYDCDKQGCRPMDPNTAGATAIPPAGTAPGNRVKGTDVLTLRYVDSQRGWVIGNHTQIQVDRAFPNQIQRILLAPGPGEPPASDFGTGHLALLADCSGGQIFAVDRHGNALLPNGDNARPPSAESTFAAAKLFDFDRDYVTVTYYLKMVDDGLGGRTGALIRQVNGEPHELIHGIERLDFRYGVETAQGKASYLTAAEVDAGTQCPPGPARRPLNAAGEDVGCLWRAVKSIQLSMLLSGHTPLPTLRNDELAYAYEPDGLPDPASRPPDAHPIKPSDQGFPAPLLRREFNVVTSVRNFNP